ncbi:hypothetical protein T484DRAFT_2285598 [Baffinella frigidus]|nr:hypothetical protein T484DRAFT_2285598 [Cryptophyta sp. CCMP2293]
MSEETSASSAAVCKIQDETAAAIYAARPPRQPDGQYNAAHGPSPVVVGKLFNASSKVTPQPWPLTPRPSALAPQYSPPTPNPKPQVIRDIWNRRTWVRATQHLWTPAEVLHFQMDQCQPAGAAGESSLASMKRKPGRPRGAKDSTQRFRRRTRSDKDQGAKQGRSMSVEGPRTTEHKMGSRELKMEAMPALVKMEAMPAPMNEPAPAQIGWHGGGSTGPAVWDGLMVPPPAPMMPSASAQSCINWWTPLSAPVPAMSFDMIQTSRPNSEDCAPHMVDASQWAPGPDALLHNQQTSASSAPQGTFLPLQVQGISLPLHAHTLFTAAPSAAAHRTMLPGGMDWMHHAQPPFPGASHTPSSTRALASSRTAVRLWGATGVPRA